MIAIVVGSDPLWTGPIPLALEHAGFEARPTRTTDQAGFDVRNHGCEGCVVIVDGAALGRRDGSATWASFLAAHPSVPAVVVVWGSADPTSHEICRPPHRVLLEDPFDAAAAVLAARRAANRVPRSIAATAGRDGSDVEVAG